MSTSGKPEKKLVEEQRWWRVYEIGPYPFVRESKFGTGEASISVEELKREWEQWSEGERLDFASAYSAKLDVTPEDEKVLEFLMAYGEERVWANSALCLTRHSDKKRILRFLLDRLESSSERSGDFVQALRELGDPEAVPSLLSLYNGLLRAVAAAGEEARCDDLLDLISCCSALRKLEGSPVYEEKVKSFLDHPNELVRKRAKFALEYW